MNRPGFWILASILALVLMVGAAAPINQLIRDPHSDFAENGVCPDATPADLYETSAGWRYRRAQPSHWIYLVLARNP